MASLIEKIKRWMNRQEGKSLRSDQHHQAFDEMTDRVYGEQEHMMDRIEDEQGD